MKLPKNPHFYSAIKLGTIFIYILVIVLFANLIYQTQFNLKSKVTDLDMQVQTLRQQQDNLSLNFSEELFEDHLDYVENISLRQKLKELELELQTLQSTQQGSDLVKINDIYKQYAEFQDKLKRNTGAKLNVDTYSSIASEWGQYLISKEFDTLQSSITAGNKALDTTYQTYLASIAPKPTAGAASGNGYSYVRVETEKGTFGVYLIKVSKSSVTVKTLAAIEDDCDRDCATKSLEQYVKENNGWAAIAGSYMCPADYAQCAEKKWSFDFALYDSNDGKWINKNARSWSETGLMTFNGSSSRFYRKSSDYDGGGVTAAISNFPSLLRSGEIVVDSGDIDAYQNTKGTRGAIGTDDSNIYLAYVTGASVIDTAYAMKALGAKDALNLDGGGTTAMFINGGYVLGPGRPLANAIVLVR